MNKKLILGLLNLLLISTFAAAFAYSSDLNQRLISCTPTKDYNAGGSTVFQISGLTGSLCVFKIQNTGFGDKPDLICKVPYSKMRDMTSINPLTVQSTKNQYCRMSIKSLNKVKKYY